MEEFRARALSELDVDGKAYAYYSVLSSAQAEKLPYALKVLLEKDRKSTRLNSSHTRPSRMPSSA